MSYQCETTYIRFFLQDYYTANVIVGCPAMPSHFGQPLQQCSFLLAGQMENPVPSSTRWSQGNSRLKTEQEKPCVLALHTSRRCMTAQRDINSSDPQTSFLLCLARCYGLQVKC